MAQRRHGPTTVDSLREYGRGIAGGFLFSLPLILTMEVWAAGVLVPPTHLLAGLAATYVLLCGYNAYAGLHHETRLGEIMVDSVEELGIGLTLSAAILLLLGRIGTGTSWPEALGLIVVEGLFVAVGVSVGTAQLMGGDDATNEGRGTGGRHQTIWSELVLAFCGAVLIAANVAPTEEILLLASSMGPPLLLATIGTSLLLAATLLYFSHFVGAARFAEAKGAFAILHGTAITYASALIASALILWFFGRFAQHGLFLNVAQCVVLGIAGTLGAAAGRLLLR
jgi:putative integral membrane protein (TIGR02587 family)